MSRLPSNFRTIALAVGMLLGGAVLGQNGTVGGGAAPGAPLVKAGEVPAAPGGWIVREAAAERALQLGFSPAAEALLRELLAAKSTPASEHDKLILELSAALLDQGRLEEAQKALAGFTGPRTSAFHLRTGLIEAYRRRVEAAQADAAQVKPDELPAAETGWYYFLEGMIADLSGNLGRRNQAYAEAVKHAVSEIQRARFQLEQLRVDLLSNSVTEQEAARLKRNMERLQGQKPGYAYARYYAMALNALGHKAEAVNLLQQQLQALPPEEKQELDDMRLLLGLIAGGGSGAGRHALFGLLDHAVSPESQRIALQLLARASDSGAARTEFLGKLDQLIAAPTPHPILADLLAFRAQLSLVEKNYDGAEADAKRLLEQFPGSPLKTEALGVLTGVAWEQYRYRSAADYASRLRADLPAGDARAQLGVLVAEAYFRAGDYRSAADAYGSAEREPPTSVRPGVLLFQRVLADINSGQLDEAQTLLDQSGNAAGVDAVSRWEAEWNLARALEVAGRTAEALQRVTRIVSEPDASKIKPELYVRMAWLQARLAFQSDAPAEAIRLVDALQRRLATPEMAKLPPDLRIDVLSTSALLKAQALLAADQGHGSAAASAQAGLDQLKKLRTDYPKTDAAVYSFVVEADYYAKRGDIVTAQSLFTNLADTYPHSVYAPFALYEAALNSERLGQDKDYEYADRLLERLVTTYRTSDMVFYARLKEGDLLRKLNKFAAAQRVYELLINDPAFSRNPDVLLAQLALADCYYAQAATDPSQWENADAIYERLQDYPTAPVDLRVEAGFKHGYTQIKRGNPSRAEATWWLITNTFLLDPAQAEKLGPKGRYWMSRLLLELGDLYQRDAKLDQARKAYQLVLKEKLPAAAVAQQRLRRMAGAHANGSGTAQ